MPARPKPDMAAFQPVIRDVVALRDQLASEHSGKPKSIPRVRSTFIRVCPAHPRRRSETR